MTERQLPRLTERAEAERLARLEREAAALRANLRRRKAQQRALPAADDEHPPTGEAPEK